MRAKYTVTLGTICGILIAVGVISYQTSAPRFYNANGTSEWTQKMVVVHNVESFVPAYRTRVGFVDRTGKMVVNGKVTRENTYATFRLWNGYGIRHISVSSVLSNELIFAGNPSDVLSYRGEVYFSQIDTFGGRHFIITIPLSLTENHIVVKIWDSHGSTTSGVIEVPSEG
jgi:hypothetical protein